MSISFLCLSLVLLNLYNKVYYITNYSVNKIKQKRYLLHIVKSIFWLFIYKLNIFFINRKALINPLISDGLSAVSS